jgi:hypothetical protein
VLKLPEELTVHQLATKFAVSSNVVYYWIKNKVVTARRPNGGAQYCIVLDSQKENELAHWVSNSVKMHYRRNNGSLNETVGGAV